MGDCMMATKPDLHTNVDERIIQPDEAVGYHSHERHSYMNERQFSNMT